MIAVAVTPAVTAVAVAPTAVMRCIHQYLTMREVSSTPTVVGMTMTMTMTMLCRMLCSIGRRWTSSIGILLLVEIKLPRLAVVFIRGLVLMHGRMVVGLHRWISRGRRRWRGRGRGIVIVVVVVVMMNRRFFVLLMAII